MKKTKMLPSIAAALMLAVAATSAGADSTPSVSASAAPQFDVAPWAPILALMPDECCWSWCARSCTEDPPLVAFNHNTANVDGRRQV